MTEFGNPGRAPSPISALPPRLSSEASPKAISGRTSYLRVRLEFLRYPQLISHFFNSGEFGPPRNFTSASTCPWIDHSVSGRIHATYIALLTLGFPLAPYLKYLTLLHKFTRRTVLQKVRYRTYTVLYLLVNIGFQVLFTPLPGSFSPFLHSTASLSVISVYLGLGGGPPGFPANSSCSPVLWILTPASPFRVRDYHPLWFGFPANSAKA